MFSGRFYAKNVEVRSGVQVVALTDLPSDFGILSHRPVTGPVTGEEEAAGGCSIASTPSQGYAWWLALSGIALVFSRVGSAATLTSMTTRLTPFVGLSVSALAWGAAGCGIAVNTPGESNSAGDDPVELVCAEGERRLSELKCVDGSDDKLHEVEQCVDGEFVVESGCAQSSECTDGERVPSGEICGDESFNLELLSCVGQLLQAPECLCGAENPWNVGATAFEDIDTQADADALSETTFPWRMFFDRRSEPVTGLEHVLCTTELFTDSNPLPEFSQLVAVGELFLDTPDASGLDALKYTRYVTIAVEADELGGLGSLLEATVQLNVRAPLLESLHGLENLRTVGNLYLQSPKLTDISALAGLTEIGGFLDTVKSPNLKQFTGLQNIKAIRGDWTTSLVNADSLKTFEALQLVEGDVSVASNVDIRCELAEFFSERSVEGEITLNGFSLDATDCP